MRHYRLLVGAACALGLLAAPALAQEQNSRMSGLKLSGDKPIQIESDKLEVRDSDSIAIFTGNVSVVQGDTLMKSGVMTVHYAKQSGAADSSTSKTSSIAPAASNIERIEVDGKVYVKSQQQVATGDKGTFDMKSEVMVLTGKEVVLTEGANVIVGCKLTVQMQTGAAQLDGCGNGGGRVKMLLQPKSQGQ